MAVILVVILDNEAAPKRRHNPYQPNLVKHIVGNLKVKSLNDIPLNGGGGGLGGKSTQPQPPAPALGYKFGCASKGYVNSCWQTYLERNTFRNCPRKNDLQPPCAGSYG